MQILQNNVAGVLSGAITAAGKSIPLISVTGWPVLASGDYHLGTLVGLGPNGTETAWEVVKVTDRVGNALSVDRAQEGSTAQAWPAGTVIQMRLTAGSVATPSLVDAVRIALEQLIASSVQTSEQGTAQQLANKVNAVAGKELSTNDFTTVLLAKLNGIAAGAQVNVATNIGQGTRTTTGIPLTSSTGTGTTLPVATTTLAGLMAPADFTKLAGVATGAQVNVPTNLTVTAAAAKVTVVSSTGTNADIALATATLAGLMAPADFTKLAGIAAGAQVNVPTNLSTVYGPSQVSVAPSNGTSTLIAGATTGQAGVMTAADRVKLDGVAAGATADWVATNIPSNADMNNYTAQGSYSCVANATSATVLNLPDGVKGSAFGLQVFQAAGCIQWITKYANSATGAMDSFIRGIYNSNITPWYRIFHEGAPQTTTTTDTDGTNNTNIASTAFVQSAVGGYLSKAVTGGTVTLTAAESSNPVIALTGTLTSNLNLVLPATVKRLWAIFNNTAGAFSVTVKLAAGTGVTVAQGKRNLVYTDGTNVYDGFNDFESIAITGNSVAPTQATTDNSTKLATTAFVQAVNSADTGGSATAVKLKTPRTIALSGGATGTATGFDGTAPIVIPVTALDMAVAATGTLAVARGGTGATTSTGTGANVQAVSPALTGTPTVPTAAAATNNTQAASTAFAKTAANFPTVATQYRIGAVNTQNVFLATGWTGRDIEWAAAQEENGSLAWHSYNNGTYIKPAFILSKNGAAEFGGLLRSSGTINYSTTSACRQEGDVGSGFAEWDGAVEPMSQMQCANAGAAYMIWRATHPNIRHMAAMHVHAQNTNTAPVMVAMSMSGANFAKNTNAFIWYGDGDYQVKRNITAGGSITPNSDIRLKNVIGRIENPMEKIRGFDNIIYTRKDIDNGVKAGYSAQSVQEHFPEGIVKSPPGENQKPFIDDEVLSVDYNGVSVLHNAALVEHDDRLLKLEKFVQKYMGSNNG